MTAASVGLREQGAIGVLSEGEGKAENRLRPRRCLRGGTLLLSPPSSLSVPPPPSALSPEFWSVNHTAVGGQAVLMKQRPNQATNQTISFSCLTQWPRVAGWPRPPNAGRHKAAVGIQGGCCRCEHFPAAGGAERAGRPAPEGAPRGCTPRCLAQPPGRSFLT